MAGLKIVAVWPEQLWRTKQSAARRHQQRAIAAHPDVTLHQTGPGFPDWDDSATGLQNVRRIMPDCNVVLGYKLGGCNYGSVIDPQGLSNEILTCEAYNECWPQTTDRFGGVMHPTGGSVVQECRKAETRLVIIHHANDYHRVSAVEDYGGRVVHIPHCADPAFFLEESKPWSERDGILLTGSIGHDHYPLRWRWRKLLPKIPGAVEFQRPGNYTRSPQESDALVRKYARALGSCRVKLGCTSVWKYKLNHITEAAMAGCAHICDLPDEPCDGLLRPVSPEASDRELLDAVDASYAQAEELGKRAQETAMDQYTTAHYAERFVDAVRAALR